MVHAVRMFLVLLVALCALPALAAPRGAKKSPAGAVIVKAKLAPRPAFWIVSCTSECGPKASRLSWSDGWTAVDGEKIRKELERTCLADLKVARCARPSCSCKARLAVPAAQPTSAPASQHTAKLAAPKKVEPSSADLPRPSETRVEVTP
jgi:hypothetical protein